MNTLGVILFLGIFVLYAAGQEFSRRVAGIEGLSFWRRYGNEIHRYRFYFLGAMLSVFLASWWQEDGKSALIRAVTFMIVGLLIALVKAVSFPKGASYKPKQ